MKFFLVFITSTQPSHDLCRQSTDYNLQSLAKNNLMVRVHCDDNKCTL